MPTETAREEDRTRKAESITASPSRAATTTTTVVVTPSNTAGRSQGASKKTKPDDRTLYDFFGPGARTPPPSKKGATKSKDKAGEEEGTDFGNVGAGLRSKTASAERKKKKEQQQQQEKREEKAATAAEKVATTSTRKKRIRFADEQKKKTWKYRATVLFAIRVPNTKGGAKKGFDAKLGEGLKFLREEVHEDTVIMPREDQGKDILPIATKEDIPAYQVKLKRQYLEIPSKGAFNTIKTGESRTIKGSATMGFNKDPKTVLDEAEGDLRAMGCAIFWKPCQEMNTVTTMAFLGVPSSIEASVVKKRVDQTLKELEKELIESNPREFPKFRHDKQKWITYAITKDYPYGMPWEQFEPGKKREPNGRLSFCFQVLREDEKRLEALLSEAKDRELWSHMFGEAAFTIKMVPPAAQGEEDKLAAVRQNYIRCVQTHGSVQLSMGSTVISGLINADKRFTLRRIDKNGKGIPAIKKSVSDVLRYEKLWGEKVWLCVSKGTEGTYTGYFSSVIGGIRSYIPNWSLCPAAQIFWFLLRKGCVKEDVVKMIKDCFSIAEQRKCTKSRFSKSQGFAVVMDESGKDIIQVAQKSKAYDTTLGLSDKEKREMAAANGGGFISFGDAIEGAVEAHNFSSSISLKSVTPGKQSKRKPGSADSTGGKTLAESIFSVGGDTTVAGDALKRGEEKMNQAEEEDSWATSIASTAVDKADKMQKDIDEDFHDASNGEKEEEFEFDLTTMEMQEVEEKQTAAITRAASKLDMGSESSGSPVRPTAKGVTPRSNKHLEDGSLESVNMSLDSEGRRDMEEESKEEKETRTEESQEEEKEEDKDDNKKEDKEEDETPSETESQREYSEEFDAQWGKKFEEPDGFRQQLWNDAGPSLEAMTGWCEAIIEETKLQEDTIEWGIQMDASDLLGITSELRTFLIDEAGESGEAQREFLEDTIVGLEAMVDRQGKDDGYQTPRSTDDENSYASKSQTLAAGAHETAQEAASTPDDGGEMGQGGARSTGHGAG